MCEICGEAFREVNKLTVHKRKHTGERPFVCKVCNQGFARKLCLNNHVLLHSEEKSFLCTICGKSFAQSASLYAHTRIHRGHKPHKCDQCDKAFTTRDRLVVHSRVHSGERPYVCDICNKGFTQKYNLTVHKRSHEKGTARKSAAAHAQVEQNVQNVDNNLPNPAANANYLKPRKINATPVTEDNRLFIQSTDASYFNFGYQPLMGQPGPSYYTQF